MFLAKKSMPTVGLVKKIKYMGAFVESIMNVLLDDAWLTNRLIAEKNDFNFNFAS